VLRHEARLARESESVVEYCKARKVLFASEEVRGAEMIQAGSKWAICLMSMR